MKLKIITAFIGLFSAFSANHGNDSRHNNDKEMMQNMLSMFAPEKNKKKWNQNYMPNYDDRDFKNNNKNIDLHKNLKRKSPYYSFKYKMLKMQMLQLEVNQDLKIRDNQEYREKKANLRVNLCLLNIQLVNVNSGEQKPWMNSKNPTYEGESQWNLQPRDSKYPISINSGEQQPNNTYEAAPQFNWKSAPHFKYWSALRHQQYLISLKHAYDQYIASLANAQHIRTLESRLGTM